MMLRLSGAVVPEVAPLHDDRKELCHRDIVCLFKARGRKHGGVGAEICHQKVVEKRRPARDAELHTRLLELDGVVLPLEHVGGTHVVAELAQADAGAEHMAHDVHVDEQQLEQRSRRGDAVGRHGRAAVVAADVGLEPAGRAGRRQADEAAVELHDESSVDEREAAVGVLPDVGVDAARERYGAVHLVGREPEVDVAALAELGRGVEPGDRQPLLEHGVQPDGGERLDQRRHGRGHVAVGELDGVHPRHPARQQRPCGEQAVGELAVGVVADAAHGLTACQGVDLLPVSYRKPCEEAAVGCCLADAAAYELHEGAVCRGVEGGLHRVLMKVFPGCPGEHTVSCSLRHAPI